MNEATTNFKTWKVLCRPPDTLLNRYVLNSANTSKKHRTYTFFIRHHGILYL